MIRRKEEVSVVCLTCGYDGKAFALLSDNDIPTPTTRCPKCSKTAHAMTIQGLFQFMRASTKEIVRLKSDIFDLEAAAEDQTNDR